jgi:hypothetical protein
MNEREEHLQKHPLGSDLIVEGILVVVRLEHSEKQFISKD